MADWEMHRLGKIARFKYGKMTDKERLSDSGYPIFSGYRVTGYYDEYMYEEPQLIVVARGVGGTGDVKISPPFAYITNLSIVVELDETVADKHFIYYQFLCNNLRYLDTGAAQSQITIENLKQHKTLLPPLTQQKKIVDILSTYDKLIEANNRRIELLEQTAQELYKEWFVRFRFPGYENTKFENGLPEGWKVKRMNEFCYVTDGTHDTPKPVNVGVPLITGRCISNGFVDFSVAYNISEADHEKIKKRSGLKSGDIIFSNIGTVGNCCVVDYDREFSVKNVIIFKPETMRDTAYLYYWMTSSTMQEIFAAQTNGASQQFVGLTFVRRYKLLLPNEDILEAFANNVLPIIEQKRLLHQNNLNLSAQRDLLLPRLMSGKLEVSKDEDKETTSK